MQMAGRLQELERAVTSDPLEGGSDGGYGRREEGGLGLSRRALSVGLVRKSSASIRRTISSLRCAPDFPLLTCRPGRGDTQHLLNAALRLPARAKKGCDHACRQLRRE